MDHGESQIPFERSIYSVGLTEIMINLESISREI